MARQTCDIVVAAKEQLQACHLVNGNPLTITLVDENPSEHMDCYAVYDCELNTIKVLKPSVIEQTADPEGSFARVPVEQLYVSLIVHELTHAFADQEDGTAPVSRVATEYMAYAMQLESLPKFARNKLVDQYDRNETIELHAINEGILMLAPQVFAAKSWLHFNAPENGCGFFLRIINDEVSFPKIEF